MALLSSLQEPPCGVRCGNKATTNIGPHATALSGYAVGGRNVISLLVFPTLASRSNVTFTDDSVACLKMLSYILAKGIKHLFETTGGPCIWNSAYYSFVDFGGIEGLFPAKYGRHTHICVLFHTRVG
jgi:hypothetical protein